MNSARTVTITEFGMRFKHCRAQPIASSDLLGVHATTVSWTCAQIDYEQLGSGTHQDKDGRPQTCHADISEGAV